MGNDKVQDMQCRYGGRVMHVQVFVNTDEDHNEVLRRIVAAGRGRHRAALLSQLSLYDGDSGRKIWKALQGVSSEMAADPKSRDCSIEGEGVGSHSLLIKEVDSRPRVVCSCGYAPTRDLFGRDVEDQLAEHFAFTKGTP